MELNMKLAYPKEIIIAKRKEAAVVTDLYFIPPPSSPWPRYLMPLEQNPPILWYIPIDQD